MDLRIRIEKISAEKSTVVDMADKDVTYKVNVNIKEVEHNPGSTILAFVLDLNSEPSVAHLLLSGTATIMGRKDEVQPLLTSQNQMPPPVLAKIYERVYGTLYVLCDSLQVPHPLPTLMRV